MKKKVLADTLKRCRAGIGAILLCFAGMGAVFYLYGLPGEPLIYLILLLSFLGVVLLGAAYAKDLRKADERERMIRRALSDGSLPPADTLAEADCGEMIRILRRELTQLQNRYRTDRQEEIDYYTAWVHQIKTPIAVMRMDLGGREGKEARDLEAELFRIEQYVDMALQYIRLGEGSSHDLLIREYSLDDLIREVVHKYAPQFVAKRLRLGYDGTDITVITDKKWFSCILEQILSNAIKYTAAGTVTLSLTDSCLRISDTGMGIAPEDVPRIFEKGFTGANGRLDKRSSGLGLYLCKKAADLLQIPLSVESTPGAGSRFTLDLTGKIKK